MSANNKKLRIKFELIRYPKNNTYKRLYLCVYNELCLIKAKY